MMEIVKGISSQKTVDDTITKTESNQTWCSRIVNEYNIVPGKTWGTLKQDSPLKTEWLKRACGNLVGGKEDDRWKKAMNLSRCCKIAKQFNIIQGKSWGTLKTNSPIKAEWGERFCDNLVGGSKRINCQ